MSWWGSLGSDISGAFSIVYNAVVGAGGTAVSIGEKVVGHMESDASGFTQSIFINWFFNLIVYPVVNATGWIMKEIVDNIMKIVGSLLGAIFAIPDGIAIWFQTHIERFGIASPITLSIAIGIVLLVSVAIGLLILKIIQYIVEEA